MTTKNRPVIVTYTDGSSDDRYDSYAAAIVALEATYEDCVAEHDGDLTDGGDRTLVWADESSSVDDDGANAVASIRWDDSVAEYYPCSWCDGTGTIEDEHHGDCECSRCDGTGEALDD